MSSVKRAGTSGGATIRISAPRADRRRQHVALERRDGREVELALHARDVRACARLDLDGGAGQAPLTCLRIVTVVPASWSTSMSSISLSSSSSPRPRSSIWPGGRQLP